MFFVETKGWYPSEKKGGAQKSEEEIPSGSLLAFPPHLAPVHLEDDLCRMGYQAWLGEVAQSAHIALRLELTLETRSMSLEEQLAYVAESGCSILTPYEICCLAADFARTGRGPLFVGSVRTSAEMGGLMSHLPHRHTAVVSYDTGGKLRFTRENAGCKRKDLGVLAGIRRV